MSRYVVDSVVGQVARENAARLAELTDRERSALMRGEAFPRPRPRRLVRDCSQQAVGVFDLLEREGPQTVSGLAQRHRGYSVAAVDELEELGLVERFGRTSARGVRLAAAADGTVLLSSWSMFG